MDSAQSARSGYQQYKAGAGVKSVDLSVSATYLINDHWTVRGEEKVQPKTMLMLGYRF
ncbi:MipA/OmpV family protein [Rhizobium sp. RCAM05973]|uniref:MipA/OmpV family protein n=1 Tax=Rhizobium sp. RCAM05973 TaxID=2994066 RepID=UPI0022EBA903